MEGASVLMIDQNLLPFKFKIHKSKSYQDTCRAIKIMTVRGAGAIGAAAGFAMAQAVLSAPENGYRAYIGKAKKEIESTRPTAQNLFYSVERVFRCSLNQDLKGSGNSEGEFSPLMIILSE